MRKDVANMTRHEILDALLEDGYDLRSPGAAYDVAAAIQGAARTGTLVWTPRHIVATGRRGDVLARELIAPLESRHGR